MSLKFNEFNPNETGLTRIFPDKFMQQIDCRCICNQSAALI